MSSCIHSKIILFSNGYVTIYTKLYLYKVNFNELLKSFFLPSECWLFCGISVFCYLDKWMTKVSVCCMSEMNPVLGCLDHKVKEETICYRNWKPKLNQNLYTLIQITSYRQSDAIFCGQKALEIYSMVRFWHSWRIRENIDLIQLQYSWRDKNNSLKSNLPIPRTWIDCISD